MNSNEVREKFLKFFESKGHKILPSSSLVPENDPSVLFTTAGMQQFKQYYGAPENAIKDFGNKNITTSQKCVRTGDIDEVGDATHLTFFEMLGNFSFGGYGRKEAIYYAHEFITKELGLPISYVTYFKGNEYVPKDEESRSIWESLGVQDIREDGSDVFWGPTGLNGPCGPTTEIYCKNADGQDVEVWNIVFNEYFCDGSREALDKGEAKLTKAETLGIDTGMGFERLLATVQNVKSVYDTDLFNNESTKEERVVADHIRTSMFMVSDGAFPSAEGRGYVVRKIIRRAVRLSSGKFEKYIEDYKKKYSGIYIFNNLEKIHNEVEETLKKDILAPEKIKKVVDKYLGDRNITPMRAVDNSSGMPSYIANPLIPAKDLFDLITEQGIDKDMVLDYVEKLGSGYVVPEDTIKELEILIKQHQEKSRTASAGMFKGGLANHEPQTIKLHTAHHLLLAALQQVLGKEVKQRGSNITEERLRMDFAFDRKMTEEEKTKVEEIVNNYISRGLNVVRREMPLVEAEKIGAEMEFGAKYPETVSLYFIEDENGDAISKEFCGGPHVVNTKELGHFKIQKEEASSAGVRRIKAILA